MTEPDAPLEQALFPIRTVVAETGVNAITLRAWERRYGLITPVRTPSGHRLYSQAHIDLVRRIMALQDKGIPVSRAIAWLKEHPDEPLSRVAPARRAARAPGEADGTAWADLRARMLDAVSRFDDYDLETAWNDAVEQYPVDVVLAFLLVPVDNLLRERDSGDTTGQAMAQFYRPFLLHKLGARFSNQSREAQGAKIVLAGTPGAAVALLRTGIALAQQGLRPLLFADGTPTDALVAVIRHARARGVLLLADNAPAGFDAGLALLAREGVPVFAGGDSLDATRLRAAGAVPLAGDPAADARLVRDVLTGG